MATKTKDVHAHIITRTLSYNWCEINDIGLLLGIIEEIKKDLTQAKNDGFQLEHVDDEEFVLKRIVEIKKPQVKKAAKKKTAREKVAKRR